MVFFWLTLGLLVLAGGALIKGRLYLALRQENSLMEDDIRDIIDRGTLEVDEEQPLDLEEIEREEDEFWEETWDGPDEAADF